MITISQHDARRLSIISQGLHNTHPFGKGKTALLNCIEQLSYIQIDTISVINRAHHHTLWNRLPTYREEQLDALMLDRKILEYWSHAAAYLPMRDYRYCLPYMHAIASGQKHWHTRDTKAMKKVLARIRNDGPLRARDFAPPENRAKGKWWDWKPAKLALEQLFIEGELMVSHRQGFQKVYDLAENILPGNLDTSVPSSAEYYRYLIESAIRAHGLISDQEIGYLRKGVKNGISKILKEMLSGHEITPVKVENTEQVYYTTEAILDRSARQRVSKPLSLLSPFDNAVIQRKRLQKLFEYDYQIECYVPAPKRRFGYFCLPVLYGSELVGRIDPKADRKNGTFIVQSLHLEKPVKDLDIFAARLAKSLKQFAAFHQCNQIIFHQIGTVKLIKIVQQHLTQ